MKEKQDTTKMLEQHMLGQQMQQMQQQMLVLDQQIQELGQLNSDLSSLQDQENAKTFSPLGGGVFVESEIKKSDAVFLNVGANIIVKKPKKQAIEIIERQIDQLKQIQQQFEQEATKLNLNMLS